MNSSVLSARARRAVPARPISTAAATFTQRAVYLYMMIQFISQAALIMEGLGTYRSILRAVGYVSSLAMLVILSAMPERRSPVRGVALAFMVILCCGLMNPRSNTPLAILGAITLNLAVWGPVFWCARVQGSPNFMRNVLLLFWGFNVAGSIVGVLQIYYPGTFSPSAEFVRKLVGVYADGLIITLADGSQVWRPMGLSDSPGGAAMAGSFAVILGLAFAATERSILIRIVAIAGAAAGMFCIYICETRSLLVMTVIGMWAYLGVMAARQRLMRMGLVLAAGSAITLGGFFWAFAVGGSATTNRVESLADQPASDVYYTNRGHFVERTIVELLPEYPLGAGLGRWGMVSSYFADPNLPDSAAIWVEVQLTAWLLDGGIPLVLLGYLALMMACVASARLALHGRDPKIADMAAAVTCINIALIMVTFNYPVFISQSGMMFWVLNGLLHASAWSTQRRVRAGINGRAV